MSLMHVFVFLHNSQAQVLHTVCQHVTASLPVMKYDEHTHTHTHTHNICIHLRICTAILDARHNTLAKDSRTLQSRRICSYIHEGACTHIVAVGACPVALSQRSGTWVGEDDAQVGEAVNSQAFAEDAGEGNGVLQDRGAMRSALRKYLGRYRVDR
jgi:hypothetical protein